MPDFLNSSYFFTYAAKRLKHTSFFTAAHRVVRYSRRFLFIGRLIRCIGIAVTVIETSAILILLSAAALAAVPLIVTALAVFFVIDRVVGTRIIDSPDFKEYLKRERIAVIKDAAGFGQGLATELAERGYAVFVLTCDLHRRFVSAGRYSDVYYVRHAFFFRLKRTHFKSLEDKLIYLL